MYIFYPITIGKIGDGMLNYIPTNNNPKVVKLIGAFPSLLLIKIKNNEEGGGG